MYKCLNCGKILQEKDVQKRVICPYCGYRIVIKMRPQTIKEVLAR